MSEHEWRDCIDGTTKESMKIDSLRAECITLQVQLKQVTAERDEARVMLRKATCPSCANKGRVISYGHPRGPVPCTWCIERGKVLGGWVIKNPILGRLEM